LRRNTHRGFHPQPGLAVPPGEDAGRHRGGSGHRAATFLDAQFLATRLLGDAIATNLFLLGYAWQKGWVPVSAASLDKAIELNGAAVDMNRQACCGAAAPPWT
jgi:indolepyruvate ferredoxin oxidoreductase